MLPVRPDLAPGEQTLAALRDLLAAFQRADRLAQGRLLAGQEHLLYPGLVTVLLRAIVILFAEDRGLLPLDHGVYAASLALTRLHAALQSDHHRSGERLDDRYGAWARLLKLSRLLHQGAGAADGLILPPRGGRLFDPDAFPFLEGRPAGDRGPLPDPLDLPRIPDGVVFRMIDKLLVVGGERLRYSDLDVEHLGRLYEGLMGFEVRVARGESGALYLQPGEGRRRLGAHYTTREITKVMVERTLRPLLRPDMAPEEILDLRICDPAMGAGAFLVEACRTLGDALARAWERAGESRDGAAPDLPIGDDPILHARRLIARHCLYGVDKDALAVEIARISLWLVASARDDAFTFVDHALRHGDAVIGLSREEVDRVAQGPSRWTPDQRRAAGDVILATAFAFDGRRAQARARAALPELVTRWIAGAGVPELDERLAAFRARHCSFHWEIELPEIFARGGFDAFIGNPPWVAYAGRAAQPLSGELRDFYAATSPAFGGYRTLQGIFVHRAATMLRPGGRLGLVLPTSMSDLAGYEPSRRAHDALCACDDDLPDFGDRAFERVFQPSMGLLSTRRAAPRFLAKAGAWPLARSDLDAEAAALLDRLAALPKLPGHLFGERGFQTSGGDVKHLRALSGPAGPFTVEVRVGGDIEPFLRRPPSLYCDPSLFGGRFRPDTDWRAVKLLIRQTARFPMVALSDGVAFRNSILAGFSDGPWSEAFLLAYLNSMPVRWFHYMLHRDARQGMPQVKIAHLRAIPAPEGEGRLAEIAALGRALGEANRGISPAEQRELDRLACDALDLAREERAVIGQWAARYNEGKESTLVSRLDSHGQEPIPRDSLARSPPPQVKPPAKRALLGTPDDAAGGPVGDVVVK